jgi:hypothetical protein
VNRGAVFIFTASFSPPLLTAKHFCLTTAADIAVTGPAFSQADWKM